MKTGESILHKRVCLVFLSILFVTSEFGFWRKKIQVKAEIFLRYSLMWCYRDSHNTWDLENDLGTLNRHFRKNKHILQYKKMCGKIERCLLNCIESFNLNLLYLFKVAYMYIKSKICLMYSGTPCLYTYMYVSTYPL